MSIKFRNKEVRNPLLRAVVLLILMVAMVFLLLMVPVMLVLHPFFRIFGLKGTVRQEGMGAISLKLDAESFARRTY